MTSSSCQHALCLVKVFLKTFWSSCCWTDSTVKCNVLSFHLFISTHACLIYGPEKKIIKLKIKMVNNSHYTYTTQYTNCVQCKYVLHQIRIFWWLVCYSGHYMFCPLYHLKEIFRLSSISIVGLYFFPEARWGEKITAVNTKYIFCKNALNMLSLNMQ